VSADLTGADLTGCRIYGVSAWNLKLAGAKQQNLVITGAGEHAVTVDNIEVAQFIYLMLHNQKIRDVIDTITSKAVLILGRFTDERKAVLDALREELRKRDYSATTETGLPCDPSCGPFPGRFFFPTLFPTGFKKPPFYGHFWGATRSPASAAAARAPRSATQPSRHRAA
jgi:hypothetical protein